MISKLCRVATFFLTFLTFFFFIAYTLAILPDMLCFCIRGSLGTKMKIKMAELLDKVLTCCQMLFASQSDVK